jgi:hypothetical protein
MEPLSGASCTTTLASWQRVEHWLMARTVLTSATSQFCRVIKAQAWANRSSASSSRGLGHKKIILYAVPGKEPFYRKFGFLRMNTAMAIFENQQQQLERGYLSEA